MTNIHTRIARTLAAAGVVGSVFYAAGFVTVATDDEVAARDALGFDSFTGYIDDFEVIIL